ncbi:MAG: UDP-galactopyranose mutase [Candidatus Fonsibacter ubiquis]
MDFSLNKNKYDYLIIGCGLFGSTFARLATDAGKSCLIIDKRNHIAGNCYTEKVEGINVHKYGPHIFHTSNQKVWEFVNKFSNFNNYINSPKAFSKGKLYSLPFNMNTFYEIWGTTIPHNAKSIIDMQRFSGHPKNLEEQALSLVGRDVYNLLIKEYTEKQWGKKATDLPQFIIKRIPLRFTFDNNYFDDKYQGVPIGGYTKLFENMLNGIEVKLNVDYFKNREYFNNLSHKVVYTGCIDEFFDYEFGKLEYRSLKFKNKIIDRENYQGNAIINYCDYNIPYTRIMEHKHFEKVKSQKTIITFEYPIKYSENTIPYYPINDSKNQEIYKKYQEKIKSLTNFIFGGRLSEYKYMDMHVTIESAMNKFNQCNLSSLL